MNVRKARKRIEHTEIRDLSEAVYEGSKRGRPLDTMITVHPGMMDKQPDDPGVFFRRVVRNYIDIWLRRRGCPWWAIWTRENYEGENREHLHIMAHVPTGLRKELAAAVAKWWPGNDATHVHAIEQPREALGYIAKQLTSKAQWVTRRKHDGRAAIFREKFCRRTGEPVAAVLGKRCGITKDLKKAVQERRSRAARLQAQAAARAVA